MVVENEQGHGDRHHAGQGDVPRPPAAAFAAHEGENQRFTGRVVDGLVVEQACDQVAVFVWFHGVEFRGIIRQRAQDTFAEFAARAGETALDGARARAKFATDFLQGDAGQNSVIRHKSATQGASSAPHF